MDNSWTYILTAGISILTGGAIWGFIQFMVSRSDTKKTQKNEILEGLKQVNIRIDKLEDKIDENNATNSRVRILRFSDEVMRQERHSKENFEQVLSDIDAYEHYCANHKDYKNSKTGVAIGIINKVYETCLEGNTFLV